MNKQIVFRTVLAVALLTESVAIEAQPPTCSHPLGKWNDEVKSVIEIQSYDTATGAISGQYISRSGAGSWPMAGWINSSPAASSAPGSTGMSDHADVFSLAVRWGDRGSITAWTGTCTVNAKSGLAQISTLWHTTRPNTGFEWDHILTGSEVFVPVTSAAQTRKRIPLPASQNPTNSDLPIAAAVWAGDTLYVSGWLDPDIKSHPDTQSQTVGILEDLQRFLEAQKLTLGDVVMMRVYLGGDPAKHGNMDVAGMTAGYRQFFGTQEQPNKPARTTVQVVLPAGARGALVEIDLIAVRPE